MREFKFRAWIYGVAPCMKDVKSIQFGTGKIIVLDEFGNRVVPRDKYELMQYTNINDENDTEIYEGDIVRFWLEEGFFEGYVVGVIEWMSLDAAFFISTYKCSTAIAGMNLDDIDIEVIGNFFENPELLEESK